MDAPEDRDLRLQRTSLGLLADFEALLNKYLWSACKETTIKLDPVARRFVSQGKTSELIKILEPFQEWPQLLDPHLKHFLPPLVSAFLYYLSNSQSRYFSMNKKFNDKAIPLPRGICRILYTFCKIRGEKVIVQFLNNEPRYLDSMLDSFRMWGQVPSSFADNVVFFGAPMVWEERYIMLLWLSHLVLSPFDLDSISSVTLENFNSDVKTAKIPSETPAVARQILSISVENLESAGREREAARALLVRLLLRPDMYRLGLLHSLFEWSMSSLNVPDEDLKPIYTHIGILSFLNGVITSASIATIKPFLNSVLRLVHLIITQSSEAFKALFSSAMARKYIIKILRSLTLQFLQTRVSLPSFDQSTQADSVLEDTIDHLLSFLADQDTSVRFAASKALSVIAAKLDSSIAVQIADAVIEAFNQDIIWEADPRIPKDFIMKPNSQKRNLAAINPSRWHGLVLTLSNLIYRRSTAPEQLSGILNTLIVALGFEQRSSVGSSLGTSVRDAACFGIWALARRYKTEELLAIDMSTVGADNGEPSSCSVLQLLVWRTLQAATLDSSGNIRRGASAALQEMIGRHPHVIIEGIALVQIVDYHAVSIRSKAMLEVALAASQLDNSYHNTILDGLLEWRGIGSPNANSRRWAASAVGTLATSKTQADFDLILTQVLGSLRAIQAHQIEERHGLLLSLAAMITKAEARLSRSFKVNLKNVWDVFCLIVSLSGRDFKNSTSRPELTAEALCAMISALSLIIPSHELLAADPNLSFFSESLGIFTGVLDNSLLRKEDNIVTISSKATQDLFRVLKSDQRSDLMYKWVSFLRGQDSSQFRATGGSIGHIACIGAIFHFFLNPQIPTEPDKAIIEVLLSQTKSHIAIESRVAAIKSLNNGVLNCNVTTLSVLEALGYCLDDYTTDQRGDIGSLVRIEAVDAISVALQHDLLDDYEIKRSLLAKTCRLAAEKLDKVRFRAWACIQNNWGAFDNISTPTIQIHNIDLVSTKEYYRQILDMWPVKGLGVPILEGYASSTSAGSESVIRSSRAALVSWTEGLSAVDLGRFCNDIVTVMRAQTLNDRLIIPALSMIAFLSEVAILDRLDRETIWWRDLFNIIQKAHYKSQSIVKLEAAIHAYTGIATVKPIRGQVLDKLCNMLLHPFPLVRGSAADSLFQITYLADLRKLRISDSPKELQAVVQSIRQKLKTEID